MSTQNTFLFFKKTTAKIALSAIVVQMLLPFLGLGSIVNNTFAALPAPGGVDTNITLWLKADTGTVGISPITSWVDQSGNTNNPTINGDPSLGTSVFNFNPAVNLDGTGDYFSWTGLMSSFTGVEIFTMLSVPEASPSTSREIWDMSNLSQGSTYPYSDGNIYDELGGNLEVSIHHR